jgi:hypothetical protein
VTQHLARDILFPINLTAYFPLQSQQGKHISHLSEDQIVMAPSASLTVLSPMIFIDKANITGIGKAEGTAQALYCPVTNGTAKR